jgi:para-aminobenzoate synthetase / 4-amino-4-deoxychorismate lyase
LPPEIWNLKSGIKSMTEGFAVLHDSAGKRWLRFEAPNRIIKVFATEDVLPALQSVESLVYENGWYAAGFLSYEAARAFDPALKAHPIKEFPLLWFGLYAKAEATELPAADYEAYSLSAPVPSVGRDAYDRAIRCVKRYIETGDTYQVNYTIRLNAAFHGNPWHLFLAMVRAQSAGYAAYVDTGRYAICSASPELFFQLNRKLLSCKPMKGTVHRGRTLEEDKALAAWLQNSEKNRAENLMIVDMIRNDLGRVADVGSVHVRSMFDVERHPTLWQMTSTIDARSGRSFADIMAALFPCASITGAPKVRTSEIIVELEPAPRRIYTGSIGFLTPGGDAQFNVAIRTAVADRMAEQVEYGSGGGIVWDSASRDEYGEALLKALVLTERRPEFDLLETMLWTPEDSYFLLEYHLRRLSDSAEYFGYRVPIEEVRRRLLDQQNHFSEPRRVRLLAGREGAVAIQADPLNAKDCGGPLRVALAQAPIHSEDIFLYHKTTNRRMYENARQAHPDCDDVLLWNEKRELTESCVANVVVEIDGGLFTPPVDCGLLAGTFRAWLLDQNRIQERTLRIDDLKQCSRSWLINSVRKWQEAKLNRFEI